MTHHTFPLIQEFLKHAIEIYVLSNTHISTKSLIYRFCMNHKRHAIADCDFHAYSDSLRLSTMEKSTEPAPKTPNGCKSFSYFKTLVCMQSRSGVLWFVDNRYIL